MSLKQKRWIPLSLLAAICFAICNSAITEITSKSNPISCIFYFSSGPILASAIYHLFKAGRNYRKQGVFWCD